MPFDDKDKFPIWLPTVSLMFLHEQDKAKRSHEMVRLRPVIEVLGS